VEKKAAAQECYKMKFNWKHILLFLAVLGPGIITASVDNDAGGIATYSIAGAHFGYSLLWTLIPITIVLIIVQEMAARMGAVTGKGLADLIRENFGLKITLWITIGLLIANIATTIAEFAGIAAAAGMFGISKYLIVPFAAIIIFWLVLRSNYKTLEKIFLILSLFYVTYIISGFMAKPDWGLALKSTLVPSFQFNANYLLVFIGVIGTTITPWMQFYLQSSIVEKGIRTDNYKYSKWDVIIGCFITNIVSFFIIVASAATIFVAGIQIVDATDAAHALAPLAGSYAAALFAFGLFSAALFGAFILPLSTSFYICEGFGWESGVNKKFREAPQFYVLFSAIILISAAVILIPKINLIYLMLASQVINGILLPVVLVSMLKLTNNKKLMGEYTNSKIYNFFVWIAIVGIGALSILLVLTTIFPNLFAFI